MAFKDIRLLLRDRAGFFFTFFWPILMAVFFGSIFGGMGSGTSGIRVVLVDEDTSAESQTFGERLAADPDLLLERGEREAALERVRRGQVSAAIILPEGFGEHDRDRFVSAPPRVEVAADPSSRATQAMLQGILLRNGAQQLEERLTDRAAMRDLADRSSEAVSAASPFEGQGKVLQLLRLLAELPERQGDADADGSSGAGPNFEPLTIESLDVVRQRSGPTNYFAVSFPQGMVWGLIGCAAAFGISLASERTHGTLVRLRIAPLSAASILGGKALACFLTALGMCGLLLLLGVTVFGVRPGSWPLLGMALISSAICFVGIMMTLSVLGRTERSASGIGWAILLVLSMIGGGMVPLFVMPTWLRTFSDWSPVKWAVLAMEGAIWRGFSLQEMLLPCAILVAVGGVTFGLGARLFRWGEGR